MIKMYIIYFLGTLACIICLLSNQLTHSTSSPHYLYEKDSSAIFNSLASDEYQVNILLGIGICIPIFIDLVIDLTGFGPAHANPHTIFQLGLVLSSLIVVDLIISVWVIPFSQAQYFGSISACRTVLCFTATFSHLKGCGGEMFQGKLMFIFAILGFLCPCLRAYNSVIDTVDMRISLLLFNLIFFLVVSFKCYRWFRSIREYKPTELSSEQLSCSVYLISVFLSSISQIVISQFTGLGVNPDSSATSVVVNGVSSAIFVIMISILHGRISRVEVVQTQVHISIYLHH